MTSKSQHLEAHEELCSERYSTINKTLERIEIICKKNAEDVVELKTNFAANKGSGAGFWKAFAVISSGVSTLSVLVGMYFMIKGS